MLRKELIKRKKLKNDAIQWRGTEVLRIEAFSDAVFAFSLTLLIVSLEVPRTFDELMNTMKGFFAFAISFTLLFQIWYAQFRYFRRYGLQSFYSLILNACLLFVVLFYMYPLKFLFSLLVSQSMQNVKAGEVVIRESQVPELMIIYGAGFVSVQFIFILLYIHALKQQDELKLSDKEIFATRSGIYSYSILMSIGIASILFAYFVSASDSGYAGWIYMLIGPIMTIYHSMRSRIAKEKFGVG